jgi:hypothetical protein
MGLGLVLTTAKGQGDVAVERFASLARLLGVAGELARGARPENAAAAAKP